MGQATIRITIVQVAPTMNSAAIDQILAWVKANVSDKIPATATADIRITDIIP